MRGLKRLLERAGRALSRNADKVAWLIVALAVAAFLRESWTPTAHIDDAYIAYRYSKNLVAGRGLVFNPGERVEGFTSPAWVFLVALGMKLGFDAPVVSHALDLASGAVLLCASYVYAAVGLEGRRLWGAALTPWLLFSTTSFAYWATSGLETPLVCAAAALALIFVARERTTHAVAAALGATLVRPEAVILLGLVSLVHVHRRGVRNRASWVAPGVSGLVLAGLVSARFTYYGSIFPNTFYAKVGTIPLWLTGSYVGGFVLALFLPVAFPAVIGARAEPRLRVGAAWVGITFLSVLMEGADCFWHFRFFLPMLAPLLALAMHGASVSFGRPNVSSRFAVSSIPAAFVWFVWGPLSGVLASAVALASSWILPRSARSCTALFIATASALSVTAAVRPRLGQIPSFKRCYACKMIVGDSFYSRNKALYRIHTLDAFLANVGRQNCVLLMRARPPVRSVAAEGIGTLGYCFPGRVIDLFGLTDKTIAHTREIGAIQARAWALPAHQRTNAPYVLAQRPDYIFIQKRNSSILTFPAALDLWEEPDLERLYVWDQAALAYRLRERNQIMREPSAP